MSQVASIQAYCVAATDRREPTPEAKKLLDVSEVAAGCNCWTATTHRRQWAAMADGHRSGDGRDCLPRSIRWHTPESRYRWSPQALYDADDQGDLRWKDESPGLTRLCKESKPFKDCKRGPSLGSLVDDGAVWGDRVILFPRLGGDYTCR